MDDISCQEKKKGNQLVLGDYTFVQTAEQLLFRLVEIVISTHSASE